MRTIFISNIETMFQFKIYITKAIVASVQPPMTEKGHVIF